MIYSICKNISLFLAKIFFRFKAYYVERVPLDKGAILACNHASYFDPPLSGIAIRKPLYFFARRTLMKNAFTKWFFKKLNCIPVDRDRLDTQTFRRVVNLVKNNQIVVLFPEGTRSRTNHLQEAKQGSGMLISHSGGFVVPCYISGAAEALPRGSAFPRFKKIRVIYGEPVDYNKMPFTGNKKEVYAQIADHVMQSIGRLKKELENKIPVRKK